jgi:glutathionylspermidine synthase
MVSGLPWQIGEPLPPDMFVEIRRRTIFDHCKWDPQVGDVSILSDVPIILEPEAWKTVAAHAENLAREIREAERELAETSVLHKRLGIPWSVRRIFSSGGVKKLPPGVGRVIRFDFHFTPDGWRISEANTDVPGGFIESSGFTRLVALHYPHAEPCGNPTDMLADAISAGRSRGAIVGFVHATAYSDDRQVMTYIAKHVEARGLNTRLVAPDHVAWYDGRAVIALGGLNEFADALVRFFPAEWLPNLPRSSRWEFYFHGAETPMCNPATAMLVQSKRLPLVWDSMKTRMDSWRALLPETRDLRDVDYEKDDLWILKPAFGRVGEGIGMAGVTESKDMRWIRREARQHPDHWVAQKRFEILPMPSSRGVFFACLGVYTIDGKAAGAYGRMARQPLIDGQAQDVAVLIRK